MSYLQTEQSGTLTLSCPRCGYLNYWEWETEAEKPTAIPDGCPDCEQGPVLKRLKARFRHWKAMRRFRQPSFIPEIWAKETEEAIRFNDIVGILGKQDMNVGNTIYIPDLDTLEQELESPTYD